MTYDKELINEYAGDLALVDAIRRGTLSDEDWKIVKKMPGDNIVRALITAGDILPHELRLINAIIKEEAPYGYPTDYMSEWDDSLLDKYAEHIKGYAYKYKPEAAAIDPSIDPNEEHYGPMAQDVEKVSADLVEEGPSGEKRVVDGRLSLMNSVAIADIARKLKELV